MLTPPPVSSAAAASMRAESEERTRKRSARERGNATRRAASELEVEEDCGDLFVNCEEFRVLTVN